MAKAAPIPTSTETETTELPAWAQQYYSGVLGRGMSALDDPYQAYQGARIAPLSEEQLQSIEMAKRGIGNYQPYIDAAGNYITAAVNQPASAGAQNMISRATAPGAGGYDVAQGLIGQATAPGSGGLAAAQKYFDIATNERAMATVDPYLKRGISDQNVIASTPYFQKAGSMSAVNAASPYLAGGTSDQAMTLAAPYLQAAAGGSALNAANPYLQAGVGSFTSQAGAYMNPYNEAVTNRIGEMAGRNLRENILPGVNRTFIGGGTFGGSRSAEFNARAVRDAQEAALAEQNKAMQAGYGQAADIYGADAARQIQAAQASGQLSQSDLERQLSVGKTYADIASQLANQKLQAGQTAGSLTTADIQSQLATGKSFADIYSDLANRNLQAGATAGTVSLGDLSRIADIGKSAGSLAGDDASRALQAGQVSGQLRGADASRAIEGAQVSGNLSAADADRLLKASSLTSGLGSQIQNQYGTDVATMNAIGKTKQDLSQKSADLAAADFKEERDYPWQQVTRAANLVNGMNIPTTTSRTTTNAAPSALSTVASLAGSALGTIGATGGFGENGWINDIRGKTTPAAGATATGASATTPVKPKRGGLIRAKRPQKKGLGWLKEMKR